MLVAVNSVHLLRDFAATWEEGYPSQMFVARRVLFVGSSPKVAVE